jgi:hypothetical protein
VGAYVLEPEGPGVANQLAEHASTPRKIADLGAGGLVYADRDESLQLAPLCAQDAEGRISRPCQLAPHLDELLEHRLQIEVGDEAPADLHQATQAISFEHCVTHLPALSVDITVVGPVTETDAAAVGAEYARLERRPYSLGATMPTRITAAHPRGTGCPGAAVGNSHLLVCRNPDVTPKGVVSELDLVGLEGTS